MTPSKRVKEASSGGMDLKEVSEICEVPYTTLQRWFKTKRKVFEACLTYAILSKVQEIMLIAKRIKKTKLHTVTYMYSDTSGELYYHFNYHDGSKSYLIKASDLQVII